MILEENLRVGNYELLGKQLDYDTVHSIERSKEREPHFRKVGDMVIVLAPTLSTHVKDAFEALIQDWLNVGRSNPQEHDILDIKAIGTATRYEAEKEARMRGRSVPETSYAFGFQFYAWKGAPRVIKHSEEKVKS